VSSPTLLLPHRGGGGRAWRYAVEGDACREPAHACVRAGSRSTLVRVERARGLTGAERRDETEIKRQKGKKRSGDDSERCGRAVRAGGYERCER
jgi:hypothetical protein